MRPRFLMSYWYFQKLDLDAFLAKHFTQPYPDLFADSGAFSAMTQGAAISLDEYAEWLKRWRHLFSVYANLDVIKNAKATWSNQKLLEDKHGLTPLPVFHVLEDFSWLEKYVDQYPYIALGVAGMQQRKDAVMAWITKCFRIAGERSVFHGFGLTGWPVMKSFPWYSVDSSSWGQGFRFGLVPLFDLRKGSFTKAQLGDWEGCKQKAGIFREFGFDWRDFADRTRNSREKICGVSAISYLYAEKWLRARHGPVYIPSSVHEPGARVYLADANPQRFVEAAQGIKIYLADTYKHHFVFVGRALRTHKGENHVHDH